MKKGSRKKIEEVKVPEPIKHEPEPGPTPAKVSTRPTHELHKVFRCYMGHLTYGPMKSEQVSCVYCNSLATQFLFKPGDLCICSHPFNSHSPYCSVCGATDDGEGNYVHKCTAFVPMH